MNQTINQYEASSLGFSPGHWPRRFIGNNDVSNTLLRLVRDIDGDVMYAVYLDKDGHEVKVFND